MIAIFIYLTLINKSKKYFAQILLHLFNLKYDDLITSQNILFFKINKIAIGYIN